MRTKMQYRVIAVVIGAFLMLGLSGCRLAQENTYGDTMIGVLITTEYLDLFDMEGYLNDNIGSVSGGNITVDGNTEKYEGRLYAERISQIPGGEKADEGVEHEEYRFPGVYGVSFFMVSVRGEKEHDDYISLIAGPEVSDAHMSHNIGDDGNDRSIKGTIFISPSNKQETYYLNPVYQSADGRIYATAGGGMSFGGIDSEGAVGSESWDTTEVVTEGGKLKTNSLSINVSFSTMFAPDKIVIIQMDGANRRIHSDEYTPVNVPKEFTPKSETAYLIIETHKKENAVDKAITRDICSRGAESIETYSDNGHGICIKQYTQINWPK